MERVQPETSLPKIKAIKQYRAIIGQGSTNAPYVDVLFKNEIGQLTWTRTAEGSYKITLDEDDGEIPRYKTAVTIHNNGSNSAKVTTAWLDEQSWGVYSYNASNVLTDGLLTGTVFEMEIYKETIPTI